VYFVHSLVTMCADDADVAATTDYGIEFASAVERANVWGTQFHPEKSGEVGMGILRSFVTCC
jgi:glutamine amidotransferase